jgi:hypothetical protein
MPAAAAAAAGCCCCCCSLLLLSVDCMLHAATGNNGQCMLLLLLLLLLLTLQHIYIHTCMCSYECDDCALMLLLTVNAYMCVLLSVCAWMHTLCIRYAYVMHIYLLTDSACAETHHHQPSLCCRCIVITHLN